MRWAVPGVIGLALAVAWALFFSGGLRAVYGLRALVTLGQLVAPVIIIWALVRALRRRRMTSPMMVSLALGVLGLWPLFWSLGLLTVRFPYSLERSQPAATVRLPSNERLRVGWGGDRVAVNYHAATPGQRWAYDLLVEPAGHGAPRLEEYGCYGTMVVAPVAARVHYVVDGEPDQVPGRISRNRRAPMGNGVVFALETGTFLVIAHLKPGSVLVKEGDAVAEGAPIGQCGNSGNTSEPHIHIHHQRQDPRGSMVFAEGLPLYFRDHGGPAMPEGGLEIREGTFVPTGAVVQHGGS